MGLLRRIADLARTTMTEGPRIPSRDKPLSDLTDAELEEELLRRRRLRAERRARGSYTQESDRDPRSPQNKQIAQWYANLELEPGASIDAVRKAYKDLMQRYHPDKHATDSERHRAATQLAQSLTSAYEALVAHLERK